MNGNSPNAWRRSARGRRRPGVVAPWRARWLVRLPDGPGNIQLMLIVSITTVLITRAALASMGYPQVGNSTLHVAHALWGGLLMLVGLTMALFFARRTARVGTILFGGIGWGLFVDEVGKFITQTNNYFFRPAVAIIYIVFAGLLWLNTQIRTRGSAASGGDVSEAAMIVGAGLTTGLTSGERASVLRLLAGHDDETGQAVRRLLDLAPARPPSMPLRRLLRRPVAIARRLADQPRVVAGMVALFLISRVIVGTIFVAEALSVATGHHLGPGQDRGAVLASAVVRPLEAVLVAIGVVTWHRNRRRALGWLTGAVYVNLYVTQLFNFTDSQFAALPELPFQLMMLALLSYHRRRLSSADGDRPG